MICVRCLRDSAKIVATAPDGSGAWEIYACSECNYNWRSSEPEEITVIEKRDPWGQLNGKDFSSFKKQDYRTAKKAPK